MKEQEFSEKLLVLAEILGEELSKGRVGAYWELFKSYPDKKINKMLNQAAITSRFFPKPAELLEFINGKPEDNALIAWQKVMDKIIDDGYYSSVIFDDLLIHKVIDDLGGWQWMSTIPDDELRWVQKDFEKRYIIYSKRPDNREVPSHLMGFHEQGNRARGFEKFIPKLVGDRRMEQIIDQHQETSSEDSARNIQRIREIV